MELTKEQSLSLFSTLVTLSQHDDYKEIVKLDITPLEAAKVQVKLFESIEEHGEKEAEKLLENALTEGIRALYNDIVNAATPKKAKG